MSEGENNKKLLSRWDVIWLLVTFFIILAVMLPKCGINMVQTTEESEIIHKPHQD